MDHPPPRLNHRRRGLHDAEQGHLTIPHQPRTLTYTGRATTLPASGPGLLPHDGLVGALPAQKLPLFSRVLGALGVANPAIEASTTVGRLATPTRVGSPLVTPGLEEAWIAAGSGLAGVIIGVAGTLLGNLISNKAAKAAIEANSDDVRRQIEAASVDVKAQLEAASADVRAQIDASATTVVAQIEADRRNRLWEKQAAAYVDAIKSVQHLREIRASQVRSILTGSPPPTDPSPVDSDDVAARLVAYASPEIVGKLRDAFEAGTQFVTTLQLLDQMPPGAERKNAVAQALQEAKAVSGLEDEQMDMIRAELHTGPGHATEAPIPMARTAHDQG
jgi:hypothetical protein